MDATTNEAAPTEAPVTAPTDGPTGEAAPTTPAAAVVTEPEPEAKEFLALRREKRAVFEERQRAKQLAQQAEALKQAVAPVQQALESFDDNPIGALEAIARARGKSVQEVFESLVLAATKHGSPPDPNERVSRLEKQIAEEREKREREAKEAMERAEAEAERRMHADLSGRIREYIKSDPERFEAAMQRPYEKVYKDLIDLRMRWHTISDEDPDVDLVLGRLEAQYSSEDEENLTKLKTAKKYAKFFQPEPATAVASQAPAHSTEQTSPAPTNAAVAPAASGTTKRPPLVRPIINRQATVPAGVTRVIRKPSSDRELIERAAALMPARYQPPR
jgi:hypothetical protein